MNRTYSSKAIRTALARGREDAELRRQDEAALAQHTRERTMSHKRTAYGPIPRPPDISKGDNLLDDWQALIDRALEVADKVAARERALSTAPISDAGRFRALGGQ